VDVLALCTQLSRYRSLGRAVRDHAQLHGGNPGAFVPELGLPTISVAPGQVLLKDIGPLALSLWIAIASLSALRSPRA